MNIIKDIPYLESNNPYHYLDIYSPEKSEATLVFFHGGGLEFCDKIDLKHVFLYLTKLGITVIAANYRLYPEAKYPEFIEDAAIVVNWAFDNHEKYGFSDKIYVSGSSAGAYLTMMLCFNPFYFKKYNVDSSLISGYIFDTGQPTTHFRVLKERGIDERSVIIDEAAPIYHIKETQVQTPLLIIVSDQDMPNRLEQTNLLYSTLIQFGYDKNKIEYKLMTGYDHAGYCHIQDPNGQYIYGDLINDFIKKSIL